MNTATTALPAEEKQAFRDGLKAVIPTMPGGFAWAMVTGMAMTKFGLTIWQALGMTFIVFAGSAQLAVLPLMVTNAPIWVMFATALIVNLRFVIFAAVIGPHFAHLPWPKRLWYGYLNADAAIGLFPLRFPFHTIGQTSGKLGFYRGICYPNWIMWQCGSVTGIVLGTQIPESWGIGFAGTLALLAFMIPLIVNRAALAGVVVAGAVAVLAFHLPYRLGLLLAVLLGMAAAMTIDILTERKNGANSGRDGENE